MLNLGYGIIIRALTASKMIKFALSVTLIIVNGFAFKLSHRNTFPKVRPLCAASQVIAAQPTAEEFLSLLEPGLKKTCLAMFYSCKEIAYKIRTASCDKMACFNEFGDEQLAIDILANNVIFQNLKACGSVATASSEETPTERGVEWRSIDLSAEKISSNPLASLAASSSSSSKTIRLEEGPA